MNEDPITQQQFNTQLPYVPLKDTVKVNDSLYVDYMWDSLNIKVHDTPFVFELKQIILPEVTDTTVKKIEYKPSFFVPYKTKPVVINPQLRADQNYDWLTGMFLLCLIILTWIRYEGDKRISQLFKSIFARHNLNQLLRDGDIVHERITPGLMFVYLISSATLLMTLIAPYNIQVPGATSSFLLFSFLAGIILILWLMKLMAIRLSGKVFRTKAESDEYLITNIIFNTGAGLVAFPFVFAGHYADNEISIYIGGSVFILGMLLRFVRSIFVGLSAQSFPVVYLFLYLCTLEILPLLVIYKVLVS